MKSLLDINIPKKDKKINKILKKIKKYFNRNDLKFMFLYPLEKIVPFNLWFHHDSYMIIDYCQNNQHIRTRCFNNNLLTPLITIVNKNLSQLKSCLYDMSLYQPYYPETFYSMWEFLQLKHLDMNIKNFLYIGNENKLGNMEAIILYHEKYKIYYQENVYHCLINDKICEPEIDYLNQSYNVKYIKNNENMIKYDFICVDINHMMNDLYKWNNEEKDIQCMLFYLITSLSYLNKNGNMLLKLNLISSKSLSLIFDISHTFFKEYTFIRPKIVNVLNPEIFLFLNKFGIKKISSYHIFLKNLYNYKIYHLFYLNCYYDVNNPIFIKYKKKLKHWINDIKSFIKNEYKNKFTTITWHKSFDLKQIIELRPFNKMYNTQESINKNGFIRYNLNITNKNIYIKLIKSDKLFMYPYYNDLLIKKAELNYYKRVMDTKPSKIFISNQINNNNNNYFITWEDLTYALDSYNMAKKILKEHKVEMLTNAWMKMYEILYNVMDEIIYQKKNIKTFHLCEAPGAYISAFNYYLSNKIKWEWYAQSLNPNINNALNDSFGLISSNPDRWIFGNENDNSGDITHSEIIKYYSSHIKLQNIDFITSDAGIYCPPNKLNEQESFMNKINMGQIICILACLSINGSAILKTFLPMTEPLTISMIYILSHLFESIEFIKPKTSHSYNSEIYLLLKKYKGISKDILNILYILLDDPKITSKTLLFIEFDKNFFKSYVNAISNLIDNQILSLQNNYYYYYHFDEINDSSHLSHQWLKENLLINPKNKLIN